MYSGLIEAFAAARNPENAAPMAAYMQNKFPFLGLNKPARAALEKNFFAKLKQESKINWKWVFELWALPEREYQYLVFDYLQVMRNFLAAEDISKLEKLITRKSWWDTVDGLDSLVGALAQKYPALLKTHIAKFSRSPNIWLKRTAIDFQLKFKDKTDTAMLSQVILANLDTGEFFVNKAIGWSLREYSKTNKKWVKEFVRRYRTKMAKLSVREASKYL
ncbi:MAG: DNA alkylation repair protein [Candidatus Margulisbacteria bacterium]|jgi:3-methyladenine DNA glycosylase AlkD|nr:DNA alkylation repair protein [Candidatus Margulisiibacteriota bacterium]